jgi:replication factor C small subunit
MWLSKLAILIGKMKDNTLWVERYRPDILDNYIGNETVKTKLAQYIKEQDIPHLLFYGTAGTGKTTAGKILCNNIDADTLYINASSENGVDIIRNKIKGFASTIGFKKLKIIFLDEADYITPEGQAALRNTMEAYSTSTRFILTCNYVERIMDAIVSRSQAYKLTPPSKKEVATHLSKILDQENITYDKQSIVHIINAYYPDIRKIINVSQQSVQNDKLVVNLENLIAADYKLKILDILTSNLPGNDKFIEIRKIVQNANLRDFTELYSFLFSEVDSYANNNTSQCILHIAEGARWDAFVVDKEINFCATITNIVQTIQ